MPQTSSTQSNKASKSRKALADNVKKYKQYFKPGDTLVYLNVPAHKQGEVSFIIEGITAEQAEGVLSAVQQGIVKSRGVSDPRLVKLQELVSAQRAAEAAVAGDGDQIPSTRKHMRAGVTHCSVASTRSVVQYLS
jgi:hypothetical protein